MHVYVSYIPSVVFGQRVIWLQQIFYCNCLSACITRNSTPDINVITSNSNVTAITHINYTIIIIQCAVFNTL